MNPHHCLLERNILLKKTNSAIYAEVIFIDLIHNIGTKTFTTKKAQLLSY